MIEMLLVLAITLPIVMGLAIWKIYKQRDEIKALNGRLRWTADECRRYQTLYRVEQDSHLESLRKFKVTIEVGHTFHVPNNTKWKSTFRNTTQRVISIDYDDSTFRSVSVKTGDHNTWKNDFSQIGEYTWINNKTLKHKFIK